MLEVEPVFPTNCCKARLPLHYCNCCFSVCIGFYLFCHLKYRFKFQLPPIQLQLPSKHLVVFGPRAVRHRGMFQTEI
uniref:Uncharacterized protein n=1 Tax=Aegilops tauschii subsp. strangulata TaxID=200361 RepID=A0A453M1F5_AEGTS